MTDPLISTTVESYLAVTTLPYELTIVDNGSTDGSRDVIQEICRRQPTVKAVLLDGNLGGEAINFGFESPRGRYLHVSENDLEYLPGWDADLMEKFRLFPELGQLSP